MYFTYNKLFLIMGKLFVISAPSGTGKTSLIQAVLEDPVASNTSRGLSYTTRKARPKEKDGVSYFFTSQMGFMEKVKNNDFLEYAEVFGNFYGTPKDWVLSALSKKENFTTKNSFILDRSRKQNSSKCDRPMKFGNP